MDNNLRQRLLDMAEEDQRVRAELAVSGELFQGYSDKMAAVHCRNAAELAHIINAVGWPGKSLVGVDGAAAAWLVVQHAIGNPELQRKCLPLLQNAAACGEAEAGQVAHLEDRICFFERRPQRYGTQFDWDESGQLAPWLLDNPEEVDKRRAAIGLPPLAQQMEKMRAGLADNEAPPEDYHKRQEEMMAWARSAGWV